METTKFSKIRSANELKKIEKAIKEGFVESEKFLKQEEQKKYSGFKFCFQ